MQHAALQQRCVPHSTASKLLELMLHLMQKINNKEICMTTNLTNNMSDFNELDDNDIEETLRQQMIILHTHYIVSNPFFMENGIVLTGL